MLNEIKFSVGEAPRSFKLSILLMIEILEFDSHEKWIFAIPYIYCCYPPMLISCFFDPPPFWGYFNGSSRCTRIAFLRGYSSLHPPSAAIAQDKLLLRAEQNILSDAEVHWQLTMYIDSIKLASSNTSKAPYAFFLDPNHPLRCFIKPYLPTKEKKSKRGKERSNAIRNKTKQVKRNKYMQHSLKSTESSVQCPTLRSCHQMVAWGCTCPCTLSALSLATVKIGCTVRTGLAWVLTFIPCRRPRVWISISYR